MSLTSSSDSQLKYHESSIGEKVLLIVIAILASLLVNTAIFIAFSNRYGSYITDLFNTPQIIADDDDDDDSYDSEQTAVDADTVEEIEVPADDEVAVVDDAVTEYSGIESVIISSSGGSFHKYYGTFSMGDSEFPIRITFYEGNSGIVSAKYENINYDISMNMKVSVPENNLIRLSGKDGKNDFIISLHNVSSDSDSALRGTAVDGSTSLSVELRPE